MHPLFATQARLLALWQESMMVASLRTAMLWADALKPTAWGQAEFTRMWTEKATAFQAGAVGALTHPANPVGAAMQPVRRRVRRNRRRLTRRALRRG